MDLPLEYYDLSIQAYKRIKSLILEDKLRPGEKLIQEKLAAELGVSRMPLHRAFQMLEHEMLVKHVPRKGIFVREVDLNEIADSLECREAVESVAVRGAIKNLSKEDIQLLYDLFAPFAKDPAAADPVKYEEADYIFHNTLMKKSGNKILQKMEMLNNVVIRYYLRGRIRKPEETFSEHIAIIDALAKKEGEKAQALVKDHFRKSRERLLEIMEKHE
jgi:DNA-binding GntR family transcriptional regulator